MLNAKNTGMYSLTRHCDKTNVKLRKLRILINVIIDL